MGSKISSYALSITAHASYCEIKHVMKHNDLSNPLLDAGDFNDIPTSSTANATLVLSWLYAAAIGFSAVLFAIGGTL